MPNTQTNLTCPTCPTCKKPAIHAYRPFCSKRCQEVDLHRWISGKYVIAGQEQISPESDAFPDEPDENE